MKYFPAAFVLPFISALIVVGCAPRDVASGPNPLGSIPRKGKVLVGPVAGAARNYHTGGFRSFADPQCGLFGAGDGLGPIVGIAAEYLTSNSMGIAARVTFDQRPGEFHQELQDAYVMSEAGGNPVLQQVALNSQVKYQLVNVDLLLKQEVAMIDKARIGVAAGPSFGIVAGGSQRQTLDLVLPLEARFVNPDGLPEEAGGRRLVVYDGNINAQKSFRASLMAGIQAELPDSNNSWMVLPSIYYDNAITDVTGTENWRLNSLVAMVDFRHAF
jgi:hypothetical protein